MVDHSTLLVKRTTPGSGVERGLYAKDVALNIGTPHCGQNQFSAFGNISMNRSSFIE